MTGTLIATWAQATDGRRDTNPFDHVETQLMRHTERVGLYEIVRHYSDHVAESLPGHIHFVDNRFVADPGAGTDLDADRRAIAAAIAQADARHRETVRDWLS